MRLVIMTPMARILDNADVTKVRVCLDDGSWLSMYAKHAPIIAAIEPCEVQYVSGEGSSSHIPVGAGIMQLKNETITIYVNETPAQTTDIAGDAPDLNLESIDRLTEQLLHLLGQDRSQPEKD